MLVKVSQKIVYYLSSTHTVFINQREDKQKLKTLYFYHPESWIWSFDSLKIHESDANLPWRQEPYFAIFETYNLIANSAYLLVNSASRE